MLVNGMDAVESNSNNDVHMVDQEVSVAVHPIQGKNSVEDSDLPSQKRSSDVPSQKRSSDVPRIGKRKKNSSKKSKKIVKEKGFKKVYTIKAKTGR